MATADLTFSTTDFFYNNVNAPIEFKSSKCSDTDNVLKNYIRGELDTKFKLNAIAAKKTDAIKAKQCVGARLATVSELGNTASHTYLAAISSEKPNAWRTKPTNEGCICEKLGIPITESNANNYVNDISKVYFCMDSISTGIEQKTIPGISEVIVPEALVTSTFNYYKAACLNKDNSTKLLGMQETNNNDLKYYDTKEFYNREYINRINLGIGIIATCGFILYSFNSSV